jgi:hypothetical protein
MRNAALMLGTVGGIDPSRPATALLLLVFSALGTNRGFGFTVFTMLPIAMSGVAGLFALGGALTGPARPSH